MKRQLQVFCQIGFLNNLCGFNTPEEEMHLLNFRMFLGSYIKLILDDEISKIENQLFQEHIINQYQQNACSPETRPEVFKKLLTFSNDIELDEHSLFFLNESNSICDRLSSFYKVKIVNINQLFLGLRSLFLNTTIPVTKGKTIWNAFKKSISDLNFEPIRFFYVNDQYLYNDDCINFFKIFIQNEGESELSITCHSKKELRKFSDKLSHSFRNSRIVVFKSDIHNRYIYTNYYWIKAGHGFDIPFRSKNTASRNDDFIIKSIFLPKEVNNGNSEFQTYLTRLIEYIEERKAKKELDALDIVYAEVN